MASLSMQFLSAMGIEEDKAQQICERHKEVLNEIKTERDKYKEDAEKLPEIQKQLDELKSKQSDGDNSEELAKLQKQLDAKNAEFEKFKSDVEAEKLGVKRESAYRKLLKDAGINEKRIDIVVKASPNEIAAIEFDKEGNVKDADKITAKIQETWEEFKVSTQNRGAGVPNPPGGNGGDDSPKPSRAAELFKKHAAEMYGNTTKED